MACASPCTVCSGFPHSVVAPLQGRGSELPIASEPDTAAPVDNWPNHFELVRPSEAATFGRHVLHGIRHLRERRCSRAPSSSSCRRAARIDGAANTRPRLVRVALASIGRLSPTGSGERAQSSGHGGSGAPGSCSSVSGVLEESAPCHSRTMDSQPTFRSSSPVQTFQNSGSGDCGR